MIENFPVERNYFYVLFRYELNSTDLCTDILVPSWWCYFGRARNFGPWSLAGGSMPLGILSWTFPCFCLYFLAMVRCATVLSCTFSEGDRASRALKSLRSQSK